MPDAPAPDPKIAQLETALGDLLDVTQDLLMRATHTEQRVEATVMGLRARISEAARLHRPNPLGNCVACMGQLSWPCPTSVALAEDGSPDCPGCCPRCGGTGTVLDSLAGPHVRCPECSGIRHGSPCPDDPDYGDDERKQ